MALKYIGNGAAVIGVPAHDLTDEQVEKAGGAEYILSLMEAGKPLYMRDDFPPGKPGKWNKREELSDDE